LLAINTAYENIMEKPIDAASFYDQIASIYDDSWEKEPLSKYIDALKWHVIEKALPSKPKGEILELGGGTGHWTIPLAKSGHRVTMIEISAGMLSVAREKMNAANLENLVELHHGDMEQLSDFSSDHYDLVLTTGGPLNYCSDYRQVLRQMRRVCKPGGYVFVDPTSRFHHLPDLLKAKDFETVRDLLHTGNIPLEFQGLRVQRHDFEIKELLNALEKEGLSPLMVVGNSVIAGIVGQKNILKMLEELGVKRLIEMEELLSKHDSLVNRAQIFEVLCRVD
jgi:ubiquinone/menaquinone biosynthesis C-methylase UbiE